MKVLTTLNIDWFYRILEQGECDIVDFKEQLENKSAFGKSQKSFGSNYEEMSKDVVAFANYKGGFILVGIHDKTKEVNADFKLDRKEEIELIKNIQSRTEPSITVKTHHITIKGTNVLVIEIPASNELHCTTKGEYVIRNFDGNKIIPQNEMIALLSDKQLIIFDKKLWKINYSSVSDDRNGYSIPGWQDIKLVRSLFNRIRLIKPDSPFLKENLREFCETLGFWDEEDDMIWPSTTGILFTGNDRAMSLFPYSEIKYIRYNEDGSYTPYEYSGDLINIAIECFNQLKSENEKYEFQFGLSRLYIENYPEKVLREVLMNAIAHRDYSKQAIIEIRKYKNYLEVESPGTFPYGITSDNYLRKVNPRNPTIVNIFREINFVEKAGSGIDKIFTELLKTGRKLPTITESNSSVTVKIESEIIFPPLVEMNFIHYKKTSRDLSLEKLLVLQNILESTEINTDDIDKNKYLQGYQTKSIIDDLMKLNFIETIKDANNNDNNIIKFKAKLLFISNPFLYS